MELARGAVPHLLWEYDASRGGWLASSAILPVHTSSPDGVSVPFRDAAIACSDAYPDSKQSDSAIPRSIMIDRRAYTLYSMYYWT